MKMNVSSTFSEKILKNVSEETNLKNVSSKETNLKNVSSEEKISELSTTFNLFDKNKKGKINIKELQSILKKLKFQNEEFPYKLELKYLIDIVDKDKDGDINYNEFLDLMWNKIIQNDSEEEILEVFKVFDRDNNGYVSKDDIKDVLGYLGENLEKDELDELMKDFDDDQDMELNYEEFKRITTLPYK